MIDHIKKLSLATAFVGGAVAMAPAAAQSTWNLTGGCVQQGANSGTYGNKFDCARDSVGASGAAGSNVTISAWSESRGTGTGQAISGSGSNWANAYLNTWSGGFGAANRTEGNIGSPDHAFDGISPGSYEMALLQFDTSIVLSQFGFGWTGKNTSDADCGGTCDSDVVLMRWSGSGSPVLSGAGTTSVGSKDMLNSTVGSGGWELVNYYLDNGTNAVTTGASSDSGSSYWLIAT